MREEILDRGNQTEDLLSRAREGDKSAFEGIIREYQDLVFSIAYHFFQNVALAEEVAQDIFLELYRRLSGIATSSHLLFWLRRSTTNRCIDQKRKAAYRAEVALDDRNEPAIAADAPDGFLSEAVRRHVAALPEKQKAALILRYQEGLEPTEIAAMLKMPVKTVKSNLYRALETLRERLERRQKVEV